METSQLKKAWFRDTGRLRASDERKRQRVKVIIDDTLAPDIQRFIFVPAYSTRGE